MQDTQRAIRQLQKYTASANSMKTSENRRSSRMHRKCQRRLASTSNDVDVRQIFLNVQRELIRQLWCDRMNRQQTLAASSDSPMSPPVTPRSSSPTVSSLYRFTSLTTADGTNICGDVECAMVIQP